eukprot:13361859-Ditylum_brightwellii.AAC.1
MGWATQNEFQYCAKQYFSDKDCHKYIHSIVPSIIKGKDPKKHASHMLNQLIVCGFIRIGSGPIHMEQIAAWMDNPWKLMKHC